MGDRERNAKKGICFTLVHGTFADGTAWVKDVSADSFRASLVAALGGDFRVGFQDNVSWGASSRVWRYLRDNRIAARLQGGENLRERIRKVAKPKGSAHYVLAHSHGGNVAMYALQDQEVREKVDGLVTMGTPFLVSTGTDDRWGLTGFIALLLAFLAFDHGSLWLWVYTVVFWVVAVAIHLVGRDPGEQLVRLRLPMAEIRQHGRPKILSIRTPGDEAFWLLRVAGRAGTGVRFLWSLLLRIGTWILWVLIALIGVRWASEQLAGDNAQVWVDELSSLLDRLVLTPILIATSAVMLSVVFLRLSYAVDSAPWITRLDTETQPTPGLGAEERMLPYDKNSRGLRHSHIQRRAVDEIAAWVREQEGSEAPGPNGSVRGVNTC